MLVNNKKLVHNNNPCTQQQCLYTTMLLHNNNACTQQCLYKITMLVHIKNACIHIKNAYTQQQCLYTLTKLVYYHIHNLSPKTVFFLQFQRKKLTIYWPKNKLDLMFKMRENLNLIL